VREEKFMAGIAQYQFRTPEKKIHSIESLDKFLKSTVCEEFTSMLEALNEAVKGKETTAECEVSPFVESCCVLLRKLSDLIDTVPPEDNPMRFGNKAFRAWHEKLEGQVDGYLQELLAPEYHPAIVELRWYLLNCLGNTVRIDYGTGHETCFMAFIFCLKKLGLFTEADNVALVFHVFTAYIAVARKLQTVYGMEPAGSHGCWSLDDYHFLVFYFGSSQLRGHPHIKPKSARLPDIYNHYADRFIYLDAIKHITKTKTGPFEEHSPMLHSITQVIHWEKVNGGMMKMYRGEVIGKFPVMQHFYFGSLIPWVE